jgi:signal peptidase I
MGPSSIRYLRRSIGFIWVVALLALLAVLAVVQLAPHTGRSTFIVRGGSMEPSIPLGSMIAVAPVDPGAVAVGDVVTIRADNGIVLTHRVLAVETQDGAPTFRLKGDANADADPTLVPARALVGRLELTVPLAGYLLAFLSMPSGMLSVLSMLGSLLLAQWLLEDLERTASAGEPAAGVAPGPASA